MNTRNCEADVPSTLLANMINNPWKVRRQLDHLRMNCFPKSKHCGVLKPQTVEDKQSRVKPIFAQMKHRNTNTGCTQQRREGVPVSELKTRRRNVNRAHPCVHQDPKSPPREVDNFKELQIIGKKKKRIQADCDGGEGQTRGWWRFRDVCRCDDIMAAKDHQIISGRGKCKQASICTNTKVIFDVIL